MDWWQCWYSHTPPGIHPAPLPAVWAPCSSRLSGKHSNMARAQRGSAPQLPNFQQSPRKNRTHHHPGPKWPRSRNHPAGICRPWVQKHTASHRSSQNEWHGWNPNWAESSDRSRVYRSLQHPRWSVQSILHCLRGPYSALSDIRWPVRLLHQLPARRHVCHWSVSFLPQWMSACKSQLILHGWLPQPPKRHSHPLLSLWCLQFLPQTWSDSIRKHRRVPLSGPDQKTPSAHSL